MTLDTIDPAALAEQTIYSRDEWAHALELLPPEQRTPHGVTRLCELASGPARAPLADVAAAMRIARHLRDTATQLRPWTRKRS